jgi:hypothetical protein
MNPPALLDTDVLIDFLRGYPRAIQFFESIRDRPLISALTVAELYAGVRDGRERETLEILLQGIEIIYVTEAIAARGGLLRREFGKTQGVGIIDAIIAATVESARATLITLNRKHFPMLEHVHVPYVKS